MAKKVAAKTALVEKYEKMDLHELEAAMVECQKDTTAADAKSALQAIRHAIRLRTRAVKAEAMKFEQENDRYLLFFDSTEGYSKLVGNSAVFYATTVAKRIPRRYRLLADRDDYSHSEIGVISCKLDEAWDRDLAKLNIFLDEKKSTSELHFYKMPTVYPEERTQELYALLRKNKKRVEEIVAPQSPLPETYADIQKIFQGVFHKTKKVPHSVAPRALVEALINDIYKLHQGYINYANARLPQNTQIALDQMLASCRNILSGMSALEMVSLIDTQETVEVLELTVKVQHVVERELVRYRKAQAKRDKEAQEKEQRDEKQSPV